MFRPDTLVEEDMANAGVGHRGTLRQAALYKAEAFGRDLGGNPAAGPAVDIAEAIKAGGTVEDPIEVWGYEQHIFILVAAALLDHGADRR